MLHSCAIQAWLKSHNTSPASGILLTDKRLIPNFALKNAIAEWQSSHNFSPPVNNTATPDGNTPLHDSGLAIMNSAPDVDEVLVKFLNISSNSYRFLS